MYNQGVDLSLPLHFHLVGVYHADWWLIKTLPTTRCVLINNLHLFGTQVK